MAGGLDRIERMNGKDSTQALTPPEIKKKRGTRKIGRYGRDIDISSLERKKRPAALLSPK